MIFQKTEKRNIYDKELTVQHALRDIDVAYNVMLAEIEKRIDMDSDKLQRLLYSDVFFLDRDIDMSFESVLAQAEQITIIKSLHDDMRTIYHEKTGHNLDDDFARSVSLEEEEEALEEEVNGVVVEEGEGSLEGGTQGGIVNELEETTEEIIEEEINNQTNSTEIPQSAPPSNTNRTNELQRRQREAEERRRRLEESTSDLDETSLLVRFTDRQNSLDIGDSRYASRSFENQVEEVQKYEELMNQPLNLNGLNGVGILLGLQHSTVTIGGETYNVSGSGGRLKITTSDGTEIYVSTDDDNNKIAFAEVNLTNGDKIIIRQNDDGSTSSKYTTRNGDNTTVVTNGNETIATTEKNGKRTTYSTNSSNGNTVLVEEKNNSKTTITKYTASNGDIIENSVVEDREGKSVFEQTTEPNGNTSSKTKYYDNDGNVTMEQTTTKTTDGVEITRRKTFDSQGNENYTYTYTANSDGTKTEKYEYADGSKAERTTYADGSSDTTYTDSQGNTETEHSDGSTQGGDSNTD